MKIEKDIRDKDYPYILCDSWGGKVYLTESDIPELIKKLKKIMKENEKRD